MLPKRLPPLGQPVPAHIVHNDVQSSSLLCPDLPHQRLDLAGHGVIDSHGDTGPASGGHQAGGLLNGSGGDSETWIAVTTR